MDLPASARETTRFEWVDQTPSTNRLLAERVADEPSDWPDFSVLVTDDQTAGLGRLGRGWVTPAGTSVASSVLIADLESIPQPMVSWLPLLAGLAVVRAVGECAGRDAATVKWPNDVLLGEQKVCGILCELTPHGVIVGAGLNLTQTRQQLPVETATSLALAGIDTTTDAVLAAYLRNLRMLVERLRGGSEAETALVRDEVVAACQTVGRSVRVILPSGETLTGTATAIDADGRIVLDGVDGSRAVAAGDITHLRY